MLDIRRTLNRKKLRRMRQDLQNYVRIFINIVDSGPYQNFDQVVDMINANKSNKICVLGLSDTDLKLYCQISAETSTFINSLITYKTDRDIYNMLINKTNDLLTSLIATIGKYFKFTIIIKNPYLSDNFPNRSYYLCNERIEFGYTLNDLGKVTAIIYDMQNPARSILAGEYPNYNKLQKRLNKCSDCDFSTASGEECSYADILSTHVEDPDYKDSLGNIVYHHRENLNLNVSIRWDTENCQGVNYQKDPLGHVLFEYGNLVGFQTDIPPTYILLFNQLIEEYSLKLNTNCEIIWQ